VGRVGEKLKTPSQKESALSFVRNAYATKRSPTDKNNYNTTKIVCQEVIFTYRAWLFLADKSRLHYKKD